MLNQPLLPKRLIHMKIFRTVRYARLLQKGCSNQNRPLRIYTYPKMLYWIPCSLSGTN
uniref:Uncharacterized protein n=1 Tax=Arundo donax TaxID=35708 RepID=A0A0A8XVN7_ARUDO